MISIIQAAGWPVWFLIACSILALAFIVERFLSLRPRQVILPGLLEEAMQVTMHGLPDAETIEQLGQSCVLGDVLAAGCQAIVRNPECTIPEMRASMEAAGRSADHRLNRLLPALGTIVSGAPLLGLFGTVIGMIEIFGSQAAAGSLSGGNPGELAHGISVALYNTAFGLIIAIPALFFWQYFRARVSGYTLELEASAERFARHLEPLCRGGNRA